MGIRQLAHYTKGLVSKRMLRKKVICLKEHGEELVGVKQNLMPIASIMTQIHGSPNLVVICIITLKKMAPEFIAVFLLPMDK
ncbi:hypothetical protein PI91_15205 [Enterobacter sp. FB]|nr:hypothetical protein PI91_15205 [Enterobacter sp. FB]OIR50006.1 hypothetical protein BH716_15400 [Lelliottia nimipressuralis]